MRPRFYHTLIFRLGFAVFCLLAGFSLVQQYFATRAFRSALFEAEERQALVVAREFAAELDEHLSPKIDVNSLRALLLRFTSKHPGLIPFVVDLNGTIVQSAIDGLNLQPFISADLLNFGSGGALLPQFTNDPRFPTQKSAFVSHQIKLAGNSGFLVLLLDHSTVKPDDSRAELVSSTSRDFLISLGFALIASLLLAGAILGTLTGRLRRLSHALVGYKPGQDLGPTAASAAAGRDEVAGLARAFESMAETINHQVGLLKERDALRRELVAGVSHDLRTPLASIRGYLQKLLEQIEAGTLSSERLRDFLETIQRNALRLDTLVTSLFELARIEALSEKITPADFSIASLLDELVNRFELLAKEREIKILRDYPAQPLTIEADRALLDRALSNLIENAIRYTDNNGVVRIELSGSGDQIMIAVKDSGRGIPEAEQERIFEKFYRGDSARSEGGMGLGLAITKRIIDAHNGQITLESRPALGCCFKITLARRFKAVQIP